MIDVQTLQKAFLDSATDNLQAMARMPARVEKLPSDADARIMQIFQYGAENSVVVITIKRYADYENVKNEDFETHSKSLGAKAASLYNTLSGQALDEFGPSKTVVTDFWTGLRFAAVSSDCGSVADPLRTIDGWVSFQLKFGAGKLPE